MNTGYFSILGSANGYSTTFGIRVVFSFLEARDLPSLSYRPDRHAFPDITGTIKGESIVGQYIPAFPLSCSLMEHPGFEPEMVRDINTWRAKILGLLNSRHARMYIRTIRN